MSRSRRIIVCTLVVIPLVLCAVAWAWSYVATERVTYDGSTRSTSLQIAIGELQVVSGENWRGDTGWSHTHMHPDWEFAELYTGLPHWQFLGVHAFWGTHPYSPGAPAGILVIPIWLLTALAAAIPATLWWRARRRRGPRGFPITGSS